MRMQWAEVQEDDLVLFVVRTSTGDDIAVETRVTLDASAAGDSLTAVNAPSWMGDDLLPADGTAELLQRGVWGKRRSEPQGWQVNVDDTLWGYVVDPGRQHLFAESKSVCGRVLSYYGPCFSEPIRDIPQCLNCVTALNRKNGEQPAEELHR